MALCFAAEDLACKIWAAMHAIKMMGNLEVGCFSHHLWSQALGTVVQQLSEGDIAEL